jgi:hypothetical protein
MRSLLPRSLSLAALLVAACAPPPPPARPAPIVTAIAPPMASATIAPAPPPDPAIVSVAAAPWPLHFALDGDLAEWGSLLPPIPPPPDPALKKPAADVPDEPPPPPNPRDAASHLAIAVSGEGALIAADLSGSARAGIWLGLDAGASSVPPIGVWQRGGGIAELDCEGPTGTGEPSPPEAIAACHQLIQRHAEFTAAHEARFRSMYRIDSEGIRAVKADGTLAPIEGAKASFKATSTGATVEIALPPKALPRLSDAPLAALRVIARIAATPKAPAFAATDWILVELPEPASFEPWGEIRAKVFETLSTRALYVPSGLSYQPGDPLHVEIVSYDRGLYDTSHVSGSEATLYTKKAALGDVEVGYVSAYGEWIAILVKGKLVDLVDLPGRLMGIVLRDGAIHVLSYSQYDSEVGSVTATWSAFVISPDGSHDEGAVQQESGMFNWTDTEEFHDEAFASFGMRGWTAFTPSGKAEGVEMTWRWNKALKAYVLRRRSVPVRKRPAKKP